MKTAEEIIISKRFFELSPSEKEAVKEYASNEEDYEAMRWFLISTGTAFAADKITPSADLKRGVMAHLNQKQMPAKTIWLNGLTTFLFPTEKRFYQFPAFQMAAVAAVIVSVVMIYQMNPMQEDLAVNETPQVIQTPSEQPVITAGQAETGELDQVTLPDATSSVNENGAEAVDLQPLAMEEKVTASVDEYYYREMSVAEEVKLSNEASDDSKSIQSESEEINVSTGAYNVASTEKLGSGVLKKQENLADSDGLFSRNENGATRKESYKADAAKDKNNEDVKVASPGVAGAATVSGDLSGTAKDEKTYHTATAGGVYSNSFNDSTVTTTTITDSDEENAARLSITETKALKKLFFVVK